jgi:hypothetical protein
MRREHIFIEVLEMPHEPTPLPPGKVAVFVFSDTYRVLKVSMAGPNSNARYQSQHYGVNRAPSTLARSLLNDRDAVQRHRLNEDNVGDWIKRHTDRVNLILGEDSYRPTLIELKDFVLRRLNPVYEGR